MKQFDLFGAPAPAAAPEKVLEKAPDKAAERAAVRPPEKPALTEATTPVEPPKAMVAIPQSSPTPVPATVTEPLPAWRRPLVETAPVAKAPRARSEPWSVSELTTRIKDLIEPAFLRIMVQGEISGFRGANARGHLYFSLKDRHSAVDVKLWATNARALKFALKDGLSVIIEGELSLYEPQGRYALIANRIEPTGIGARALAFEQIKKRLMAEGVIGENRKKPKLPLPFLPKRIGVATSMSGAALRDFVKVLHRRNPNISLLVCDARVQGDGASWEVARAIRWLALQRLDVIVVTRGGGSVDDLWTFNEEPIARAIYSSEIPVVSAVGHEIDVTLADLVADVRAPTPSAAAEVVTPVIRELHESLATAKRRLHRAVDRHLLSNSSQLTRLKGRIADPRRVLNHEKLALAEHGDSLERALDARMKVERAGLADLRARLQAARPQTLLRARREHFQSLLLRLRSQLSLGTNGHRTALMQLNHQLMHASPRQQVTGATRSLAELEARLERAMGTAVTAHRQTLSLQARSLQALSPLNVLSRGYAIVQTKGQVVRTADDVAVGDQLDVRLADDLHVLASVTAVKPKRE